MAQRTRRFRREGAAVLLLVGGALGASVLGPPVAGATTSVTLYAAPAAIGSGNCSAAATACSLGTAVFRAEETDHGDAVTITAAKGTYKVHSLKVASNNLASLDVVGKGTQGTTASVFDGTAAFQVFNVVAGAKAVTVASVEIVSGKATTGGCVEDSGTLTLSHVVMTGCEATIHGGGVDVAPTAALDVTSSTIDTDAAQVEGGGISATRPTSITLSGSTVSDDKAETGAGIQVFDGRLGLTDDTLATDTANNWGGGIDNFGAAATLTADTFSGDKSGANGGGIVTETGGHGGPHQRHRGDRLGPERWCGGQHDNERHDAGRRHHRPGHGPDSRQRAVCQRRIGHRVGLDLR